MFLMYCNQSSPAKATYVNILGFSFTFARLTYPAHQVRQTFSVYFGENNAVELQL